MFAGAGLAVSLPARELNQAGAPASVFGIADLAMDRISSDLRVAIAIVAEACRSHDLPIVFIARPEMFTNTASLAWLREKLGGIEDHLCISDGLTVRVVPYMRNHMFLYRLGIEANADAFRKLLRRAPELISTMASQVNTAFGVTLGGRRTIPPSLVLTPTAQNSGTTPALYPFFLNPHAGLRSAERSVAAGPHGAGQMPPHARLTYIPLTETAARDRMFAEIVGAELTRTYFDTSRAVVLRMPFLAAPAASMVERIAAGLAGLCAARTSIPRVVADNIWFATDDLDLAFLHANSAEITCVAHESFDFWRHPRAFYNSCATVAVHASVRRRRDRAGLRAVLGDLLGRDPGLHWLPLDDTGAR